MKAIILVGGYGTRMRPLTFSCPKPVFPFVNSTPAQHMIKALAQVGVKEIILGINCQSNSKVTEQAFEQKQQSPSQTQDKMLIPINEQAKRIIETLNPLEQKYGVKLIYSQKHQALGTAGPIKYAQKQLRQNNTEGMFFVFNSDVVCNYPLKELIQYHKQTKQQASIMLASVEDPKRFGVVVRDETNGKVEKFVQKPQIFCGNSINAGIYLLNTSVLDRIPSRFCMIETEIFPKLAEEGKLYSLKIKDNFWYDVGKPQDYIKAQGAYLEYYKISTQNNQQQKLQGILIDKSAKIGKDCTIGPNVVIGPNCKIGDGVRLRDCTLIGNVNVQNYAYVSGSIVSWDCTIRKYVRIEGLTCLAEDVEIKEEVSIKKCMICSHKSVGASVENQIIM